MANLYIMDMLMVLTEFAYTSSGGIPTLPGLPEVFYRREGDINIGVVIPLHRYDRDRPCSTTLRELGALQRVEAVAFAVDEINKRGDILPNITLGFTIMDDCSKDTTALVRGLHIIQKKNGKNTNDNDLFSIDVMGVIGSESSKNTVQLADLLSLFRIPILSYLSTSPLLSNKYVYPFFTRIVPSDTLQAKVIGDILQRFSWTYVSIIYAEGSYGSEGYKAVKSRLEAIGYCLGVIREMKQSFGSMDYDDIVKQLRKNVRARVVVIFAPLAQTRALLSSAMHNKAHEQFTWIGSDGWGRNIQDYSGLEDVALGALTVKFYSTATPRFDEYFKSLTLRNSTLNPWFKNMVEAELGCSFNLLENEVPCSKDYSFGMSRSYKPETTVSLVIDAVYTFANALHSHHQCLLDHRVVKCLNGETYLKEIRNITFMGENGIVSFDENGDGKALYEIQNLQKSSDNEYRLVSVGAWDSYTEMFTRFEEQKITWKPTVLIGSQNAPTSTCSDPCPPGHQAIRTQPHCCWYCKQCRNNEKTIIQEGLPQCQLCPTLDNFTWPDNESRQTCVEIEPTFTSLADFTGVIIITLNMFTVTMAVIVTVLFIKNNKEKLIKASSRDLSYLMLCGIFLSSIFVALLAIRPTDTSCNFTYVGFHLSFSMTYAPLTVKTNRIYRIFTAGKKSTRRPLFIDSKPQIIITALILFAQVR